MNQETGSVRRHLQNEANTRAGNGSWTAPSRDLYGTRSSASRRAGCCMPRPAGKDEKSSRGVGQRPTVFARVARVLFLSLPNTD
jgi:hypothetical protein